jgi:hypothetical protein
LIVKLKRIVAAAAFFGTLGFTAIGLSGVANAEQAVSSPLGVTWKVDKPHWNDRRDNNRDWRDGRWDGRYYGGPCLWVPPAVSGWVPPAVC